jgi:hypothetical protein
MGIRQGGCLPGRSDRNNEAILRCAGRTVNAGIQPFKARQPQGPMMGFNHTSELSMMGSTLFSLFVVSLLGGPIPFDKMGIYEASV